MLFGAHVSIAGGVFNAPLNAAHIGAEVFQIFTRSPQGGHTPKLTPEILELFKKNCTLTAQREWYVHAPYFINFASKNNRIRYGSINIIREELERSSLLRAKFLMAHLGSFKDLGKEKGFLAVVDGLEKTLAGYTGSTQFLIEISAGSGEVIGDTFEEIAEIIFHPKLKKFSIGVCLDLQHAFASGYDWRSPESVANTLKKFDKTIGLTHLKTAHCNDSKVEFNSRRDRHEHIGKGAIGLAGFRSILNNKNFQKINFICETPPDGAPEDIATLKKLRAEII